MFDTVRLRELLRAMLLALDTGVADQRLLASRRPQPPTSETSPPTRRVCERFSRPIRCPSRLASSG